MRQPIPVGIGIIRRDDRFLVRQRPEGTVYAGYWEFPGGKCEPGEDSGAGRRAANASRKPACAVVVGRCGASRRSPLSPRPGRAALLRLHDRRPGAPSRPPDSGFRWVAGRRARLASLPRGQRGRSRGTRRESRAASEALKESDSGFSGNRRLAVDDVDRSARTRGLPRAT